MRITLRSALHAVGKRALATLVVAVIVIGYAALLVCATGVEP